MTISMYAASVPTYIRQLKNASSWLDKAATNAADRKIDQVTLVRARLAPDMLPLYRQFFIATDHAKNSIARLSGLEAPKMADDEPADLASIQKRLAETAAWLEGVAAEKVNGTEEKLVKVPIGGGNEREFAGLAYLTTFAMPNFMFHSSMAYAILRHNGVPVGKLDFLAGAGA